jgi:hypothetical protein
LNAALFVNTQHDCVRRGIHIKANDIAQLLHEIRVRAEFKVLNPMRLQIMGAPNTLHGAEAHLMTLRQFARTPMRSILWGRVQRHLNDTLDLPLGNHLGPPTPRRIVEDAIEAPLLEALPHGDDVLASHADAPGDLAVREAFSRIEQDARPLDRPVRRRRLSQERGQLTPHFRKQL